MEDHRLAHELLMDEERAASVMKHQSADYLVCGKTS